MTAPMKSTQREQQLACQQETINGDDTNITATRVSSSVRLSVRLRIYQCYRFSLLLCFPIIVMNTFRTPQPAATHVTVQAKVL